TGSNAGFHTLALTNSSASLFQAGPFPMTLGNSGGNSANFTMSGGTFDTGSGTITVNKTGNFTVTGGTLALDGSLDVDGGNFFINTGSVNLEVASITDMTVHNKGEVSLDCGLQTPGGYSIDVTGTSSLLRIQNGGSLNLVNSSVMTISSGADA